MANSASGVLRYLCNAVYAKLLEYGIDRHEPIQIGATFFMVMHIVDSAICKDVVKNGIGRSFAHRSQYSI